MSYSKPDSEGFQARPESEEVGMVGDEDEDIHSGVGSQRLDESMDDGNLPLDRFLKIYIPANSHMIVLNNAEPTTEVNPEHKDDHTQPTHRTRLSFAVWTGESAASSQGLEKEALKAINTCPWKNRLIAPSLETSQDVAIKFAGLFKDEHIEVWKYDW